MTHRFFLIAAIVWACLSCQAAAQIITGSIVGTVTDQTGAVLPGVTISVKNLGTNQIRTALTNEAGNYSIPLLPVASYEVTAEFSGFTTQVKTGLELQVEQRLNVHFTLAVGEISERLVVTETSPLVQTDSATVGNVVDSRKLMELPLNGRLFSQVALLVPTATTLPAGSLMARPERDAFTVAGLTNTANNYMIDGIDNNDISINIAAAKPSMDTIREYKIQSGTYSAEFGRGGGAQINVITKSGTNEFHGSIYHFLRNSALDAKNFFDRADEKIPPFNRNQYGATIGGPIQKDKTFFFVGYEGLRTRQAITKTALVPLAEMKRGDFSSLLQPNNLLSARAIVIRDPLNNNAPFPGNIIPVSRFDPSGFAIANLYPDPNRPQTGSNYLSSPPDRLNWHQSSLRLDRILSEQDSIFGRVNFDRLRTWIAFDPGTTTLPGYGKNSLTIANNIGLVETHVFSPALVNEARLGYNYFQEDQPNGNAGFDATEQLLGIKGTSREPKVFAYPSFTITGFTRVGDRTASPQNRRVHTYQAYDGLSWIRGNHSLKIGGEVRRVQNNFNHNTTRRGAFSFTGRYTGTGLADVLLGLPSSTSLNRGPSQRYFRSTSWNFFVQDDWKVSQRLNLNLGVRYEINTPPVENGDLVSNFNPKTGKIEIAGKDIPRGVLTTDYNDIAPRIGLAYNLTGDGRTILRSGYGVYSNSLVWTSILTGAASGYPFVESLQWNSSTTRPDITMRDPFPAASAISALSLFSQDREDRSSSYIQHVSFGIQRELFGNVLADVSYLGNKATKLAISRPINQPAPGPGTAAQRNARRPFPQFGNLNQQQGSANSNYHSMIVRIERRLSNGLSFLSSYTLSKAIADQGSPDMLNNRRGRGPAGIDNRHRWTFSYVYAIPFGRGQSSPAARILGGWQLSGVLTLRSGQPSTPSISQDISNTASGNVPNLIGETRRADSDPRGGWWNPNAFALPTLYTIGNAGTGILVGPDFRNLNFSLNKNYEIGESKRVEFRAEFFNITNHPNFGQPNSQWDSPLFGRVSEALDSRQIQFGLKLIF